jgi:hypothetical protein
VDLPAELINLGTNALEVSVDLRVADKDCTRVWFDQAWATLSADSYFTVKRADPVSGDELVLTQFPDPFLRESALLLPEDPDGAELQAAAWLLNALTTLGGRRVWPFVPTFPLSEWRRAAGQARSLVAVASDAERLGDFRAAVRMPLETRSSTIELRRASGEVLFSASTVGGLAFAQIFPNPATPDGAVLLIHATGEPRLLPQVARLFSDEARLRRLKGNVVILDHDRGVRSFALDESVKVAGAPERHAWLAAVVRYRMFILPVVMVALGVFLAYLYRKTRGIRLGARS